MRLIMLGTGMAMVTKCYNTCFVLADDAGSFMVDGGGGNGIFRQTEAAGVQIAEIRDFFITPDDHGTAARGLGRGRVPVLRA